MSSACHYFAYGANMNRRVFVTRRGMRPLTVETAVLEGWELVFAHRGVPIVEPAFATIRRAPARVEGVLYRVDATELAELDRIELGYVSTDVLVAGARSGEVRARAYCARVETAGLWPSRRYLALLVEGGREAGLSAPYLERLAAGPSVHVPILSALAGRAVPGVEELHRRGFEPLRWLAPLWWMMPGRKM